jgi:SNF2 family DNA or RNA helicase
VLQPSKSEVKSRLAEGEREFRKLYMVFGDGSNMEGDKLSEAVSAYQKDLADVVYPNGGQLRDYQAEGVSWMVSNYLNGRSCLLADEMGLGYVSCYDLCISLLTSALIS